MPDSLGAIANREIITVEGVANGHLHPVQTAMVQLGGSQCGYCTPGIIISLFTAYYDRTLDDVAIEGNLCRCTGYLPIRRAAQQVAAQSNDDSDAFSQALERASVDLLPFNYDNGDRQFYRPVQLAEVFALMQQHPNATLVAGATDLGLELSWHRQQYPVMISLEAVAEPNGWSKWLRSLKLVPPCH